MSLQLMAGAVNGVPAQINVEDAGTDLVTIPVADNGVADTMDVETDGGGIYTPGGSRVAIIGGSTVGRDHFQAPAYTGTSYESDPGSEWAVETSFEDAMALVWRVKIWKITIGDVTNNEAIPPETYGGFVFYATSPATREAELVLGEPTQEIDDVRQYPSGILSFAYLRASILIGGGAGANNYYAVVFYETGLRPYLSFYLKFAYSDEDTETPNFDYSAGASQVNDIGSSVESGTLTVILPDATYTAPLYSNNSGPWQVDVTIEPTEYWPYATKAGLPVYDTSTGAQINDPLS